ncbi:F-box protein At1g30790-like [Phaseolus vulgaris]|uniref:F-box protein At1g30790-like n=1 Tax=Phaseolus vulgaris TaxID=3885 RepID=UPI0035CBCCEF
MAMISSEIFPICSYLPAKSLYRFKAVNKGFYNLLGEGFFLVNHVHNSLKRDDTCFFVQLERPCNEEVRLHLLPSQQQGSGVSSEVLQSLSKSSQILASIKGLILCRSIDKTPSEFYICNPATKSQLPISLPTHDEENLNARAHVMIMLLECYDEFDDYMVVHFETPTDWSSDYACKILKPQEGLWKTMEKGFCAGGRNIKFNMPVHDNGVIHFISDCGSYITKGSPYFEPYIMSYNLKNGTSTMLKLSKTARKSSTDKKCDMSIFNWGKVSMTSSSICLVRLKRSTFKVWILKDYKTSRWKRIMKIKTKEMCLKEKYPTITSRL